MNWKVKSALIFLGVTAVFSTGFIMGEKMTTRQLDFAHMRVNHAGEYKKLIEHYSPDIKSLAKRLQTPRKA